MARLHHRKAAKIRRLLADPEMTLAAIAQACRASIGTVRKINREFGIRIASPPPPPRETTGVGRCLQCNQLVELPCYACQMRRLIAAGHDLRTPGDGDDGITLGLELTGEELARYQAVRRWREQAAGEIPM